MGGAAGAAVCVVLVVAGGWAGTCGGCCAIADTPSVATAIARNRLALPSLMCPPPSAGWILPRGHSALEAAPAAAAAAGRLQLLVSPWLGAALREAPHLHDVERIHGRRGVSPRAADIGERGGNLLVAQGRSKRRHQADRAFLPADH